MLTLLTEVGALCGAGRAGDLERMEDDLAKAQVARIAAEAALSTGLTAADEEADALRQQLLSALQKARDAELRAADLQQRNKQLDAERQVSAAQCCYLAIRTSEAGSNYGNNRLVDFQPF